jgi:phage regulator Rha-like protein
MNNKVTVLSRRVESKILVLRGQKVILDADLAELYGVAVKRLNEQVKRNAERFPADFLFRLKPIERRALRSQIATSKTGRGGRRYQPYAFSEHGAIMAASVLNSKRAVEMSIFVVRAFVRMRGALATNQRIIAKLRDLEERVENHDADIEEILIVIRELMTPAPATGRRIGFEIPAAKGKAR